MKTANVTFENEVSSYTTEPMARAKQTMAAVKHTFRTWKDRARTRRALSQLTPRMLEDVGINPYEAMEEASKPFWRA